MISDDKKLQSWCRVEFFNQPFYLKCRSTVWSQKWVRPHTAEEYGWKKKWGGGGVVESRNIGRWETARTFLDAEIIPGSNNWELVFVKHRTKCELPLTVRDRQFPVTCTLAMTTDKSQGHSFCHVALCLLFFFVTSRFTFSWQRGRNCHYYEV
jgi:hypothetical protein